jgi:hypothetical protein
MGTMKPVPSAPVRSENLDRYLAATPMNITGWVTRRAKAAAALRLS